MQTILESKNNWPDNSMYFLTDSTFLHFPYFSNYKQKHIVLNQIKKLAKDYKIAITDYSIAINHYHLKFYLKNGKDLAIVKQALRGGISYEYRKEYLMPYKDMWQTRKILIINSEILNQKISGYIIGNLLKHKEVGTFEELKGNIFSSYWHTVKKYGDEEAKNMVYCVIDFEEDEWGVVDINNFI